VSAFEDDMAYPGIQASIPERKEFRIWTREKLHNADIDQFAHVNKAMRAAFFKAGRMKVFGDVLRAYLLQRRQRRMTIVPTPEMRPSSKRWRRLPVFWLLVAGHAVCADASAADCPQLPPSYQGPIFDANVQTWTPNLQELFTAAPLAGVKGLALFANSKAGGAESAAAVLAAAQEHPDFVIPGAPKIGFISGGDLPGGFVTATLSGVAQGTYKFVGEILYTHGDKPDHPPTRTGEVYVDPLAAGTARLLEGLKGRNTPLLTHWEAWAWDRDRPRFDTLYSNWPQQRFILPSLAYGSPDKADAILSAHSNLWGIISRLVDGRFRFVDSSKAAKLGPVMFDACGGLTPDWRAVLIKHADHLMYGSDDYATQHVGWQSYPGIIEKYRQIAGQLPPEVAHKISWDNAAVIYLGK
jgi:hypothetical protein